MKKIYVVMPDKPPYSLCAKSFAKGFKHAQIFTEKSFSSELDNEVVKKFNPDYIMCFNFNELNEGFLNELNELNPNCTFIFNFLTKINENKDKKNIEQLTNFQGNKLVFTADKYNLNIIPNLQYLPHGINFRSYKTVFEGYKSGITVMSNPNNTNVLKTITDIIQSYGQISFYSDEFDYLNSLNNEIWSEINDETVKQLYKNSYKGEIINEKERAKIFTSSVINIVPVTQTPGGVDFRAYEIAASTAFGLCEQTSEVRRLFDIGREIEVYEKSEDLIEKIDFYLKNPMLARSVAINARRAAVNNHSVQDRVNKILNLINAKKEK